MLPLVWGSPLECENNADCSNVVENSKCTHIESLTGCDGPCCVCKEGFKPNDGECVEGKLSLITMVCKMY